MKDIPVGPITQIEEVQGNVSTGRVDILGVPHLVYLVEVYWDERGQEWLAINDPDDFLNRLGGIIEDPAPIKYEGSDYMCIIFPFGFED
jgi:hypothetical protein